MGLEHMKAFPFIGHIVVVEGEESFLPLVRQVLAGKTGDYPNGVIYRQSEKIMLMPNTSLFSDFAKTSPPDYDDYYSLLAELGRTAQGLDRILLYEGSRGCWWGGETSLYVLQTQCAEHEVSGEGATTGDGGDRGALASL